MLATRRKQAVIFRALGTPKEVLERHGRAFEGRRTRCPFHDDHHPSFYVYLNRHGEHYWICRAGCGCGCAAMLEARLSGRSYRQVFDWCEQQAALSGDQT